MKQKIVGYHQDEVDDWVADLACDHTQHIRHTPPLSSRPWVLNEEGRQRFIGYELNCKICDGDDIKAERSDGSVSTFEGAVFRKDD